MEFEQVNTVTENAISVIRTEVARGILKYESDVFAFLSGYTENEAIIFPLSGKPLTKWSKKAKLKGDFK